MSCAPVEPPYRQNRSLAGLLDIPSTLQASKAGPLDHAAAAVKNEMKLYQKRNPSVSGKHCNGLAFRH